MGPTDPKCGSEVISAIDIITFDHKIGQNSSGVSRDLSEVKACGAAGELGRQLARRAFENAPSAAEAVHKVNDIAGCNGEQGGPIV